MKKLFADANYWVAVLNPKDDLHNLAMSTSTMIAKCQIITSEFVLIEMMKLMLHENRGGVHLKKKAFETVQLLRKDPNVQIVAATSILFQKACKVYLDFEDKEWDIIDCSSYIIMKEQEITEALTHDKHFKEMGFLTLLRE